MEYSSVNLLMPIVNGQVNQINREWVKSNFLFKTDAQGDENCEKNIKREVEGQKQREMLKMNDKEKSMNKLMGSQTQIREEAKEVFQNYRRVLNASIHKKYSLFPKLAKQSFSSVMSKISAHKQSFSKNLKTEKKVQDQKTDLVSDKSQKLKKSKKHLKKKGNNGAGLRKTIIGDLLKEKEKLDEKKKKNKIQQNPLNKQMNSFQFGLQSISINFQQILNKLQKMISTLSTTDKPEEDDELLLILRNELSVDAVDF